MFSPILESHTDCLFLSHLAKTVTPCCEMEFNFLSSIRESYRLLVSVTPASSRV